MRFQIDIKKAKESYINLCQYKKQIYQSLEEMQRIEKKINAYLDIEGMESLGEAFKVNLKRLESEIEDIQRMTRVLEKIIKSYESCERKVEEIYNGRQRRPHSVLIKYNNMTTVKNILNELDLS